VCKSRTAAKLNSTEMDFWRRSVRISRKDKIRNTIIKQKMNAIRSLLDNIKNQETSMVWTCSKNGRGKIIKRCYEMEPTRKKKMR